MGSMRQSFLRVLSAAKGEPWSILLTVHGKQAFIDTILLQCRSVHRRKATTLSSLLSSNHLLRTSSEKAETIPAHTAALLLTHTLESLCAFDKSTTYRLPVM